MKLKRIISAVCAADDLYRESDSDDPLDSAIFKRNRTVTEKYGFNIKVIPDENPAPGPRILYALGRDRRFVYHTDQTL